MVGQGFVSDFGGKMWATLGRKLIHSYLKVNLAQEIPQVYNRTQQERICIGRAAGYTEAETQIMRVTNGEPSISISVEATKAPKRK